jgi:transposase
MIDVLVDRCAGLDVHRDSVMATVRVPTGRRRQRRQHRRCCGTTIAELQALSEWLADFGVTRVGMEATGVYWKPVFHVLERRFECWLLNAQHPHNVPGRKTDVIDSAWICRLVEHGLVRPSFVPPPEIRRLRDLTRLRKAQTSERTRAIQRVEKVLQDVGINFTSVASRTYSVSARAMLEALLAGTTDPDELAQLARARLRAKIPQLRQALQNRFSVEHHGVLIAQLLAHIDSLELAISHLDARIEVEPRPHADLVELLCTIPGVKARTAQTLIAECGLDMTVFPTVRHLASWAGICPGNNESAGKRRSGTTRHGNRWLRQALTEAATAAARSNNTYLASHHAQIRGRCGEAKATGATRHDILVAYYHITRDRVPYRELGADWHARRYSVEHRTRRLLHQLEALGVTVTVDTTA